MLGELGVAAIADLVLIEPPVQKVAGVVHVHRLCLAMA
jgi:hypothetical protein